jgi:predicted O-linked N-acetylglucosamine transferase (SPINDLY family)
LRDPIDRITALVKDGQPVAPLLYIRAVDDPESHMACAGNFVRAAIPVMPQPLAARPVGGARRIRIAYLSPDFRIHPIGYLVPELLERHDRAYFEVMAVSYGPNDGSDIRARLVRSVDQFHDVVAKSDREIAQLVHELEVDIAVDLAGHTEHARPRVLALRPAPIQVGYLGHCGTVGAPFIDYIIADGIALPRDQQRHFCEQIVHLPDCFLVNDSTQEMSAGASSRGGAGLPDDGFVFCCFNKSYKITPEVFDVWMRLLRQVDGSVLWLTKNNDLATENLRARATRRGVDPGRVIFAPSVPRRADHLARQRLADLFLDTLPYNAQTTACDALFAGLPVLTCRGKAFGGRVAASLLHAAGLPELAVSTLDEYEALALELATDERRMQAIRRKLADNRATCPLFDADRFRRHIEAAYTMMWDIWRRGEKPRGFSVDSV